MDGFFLSRLAKPAFMFLVAFLSIFLSTHNFLAALLVGVIPAVLGSSNMSAAWGYQVAIAALLFAVILTLLPSNIKRPLYSIADDVIRGAAQSTQTIHEEAR